MTTSTNTFPMSTYIEMVNSKEYQEATLKAFERGEEKGVRAFKRKIENRIEYWTTSIRTKERTLKDTNNLCHKDILKGEIRLYKSKIEELQFLMGE